jgi:hypothetical protein
VIARDRKIDGIAVIAEIGNPGKTSSNAASAAAQLKTSSNSVEQLCSAALLFSFEQQLRFQAARQMICFHP